MKILFVDDQEDVQDIMKFVLEDELEADVDMASSISEAIELVENDSSIYDVILCDYKLPDATGISFYEKIQNKNIPFFLITGMSFEDSDPEMKILKTNDKNRFFLKPFDEDQLIGEIKKLEK